MESQTFSLLMLLLFIGPILLLNFLQTGGQDSAVIDKRHSHVVIMHRLNQLRFVWEILSSLSGKQLSDSLSRLTTFKGTRLDFCFVFVCGYSTIGCQHGDSEQKHIICSGDSSQFINFRDICVFRNNINIFFFNELLQFSLVFFVSIFYCFLSIGVRVL